MVALREIEAEIHIAYSLGRVARQGDFIGGCIHEAGQPSTESFLLLRSKYLPGMRQQPGIPAALFAQERFMRGGGVGLNARLLNHLCPVSGLKALRYVDQKTSSRAAASGEDAVNFCAACMARASLMPEARTIPPATRPLVDKN
jgi:hypothetical protein